MTDFDLCFNPLWINTALKLTYHHKLHNNVSIPYGLTLLSNVRVAFYLLLIVSIPYGLTLLSNNYNSAFIISLVSIPYGLTLLSNTIARSNAVCLFQSPMD